ncbi:3-galactosyl-N-acetylglucosaminide 4-alpha-L-fucosyltransferase FUT3-like [Discoglossus pictus]
MILKPNKKNLFFLCLLILFWITCAWFFNQFQSSFSKCQLKGTEKKGEIIILVWNWPYRQSFPVDTCQPIHGISGCILTANRTEYSNADAVIIHHMDVMNDKKLLPEAPRPPFQRWVWFNLEPPLIAKNLHIMDNLVNLTMTYRQDSDIVILYGWIKPLKKTRSFKIPEKSKLVAWVVSQWYKGDLRTQYYEELKKYMHIDIYGKHQQNLTWKDFHRTLSKYKFYLAFENSVHTDYITEKLWENAFCARSVVLGAPRENYERFIPPDSFIHVDDFSSAQDLAKFLMELDKDDVRYEQYFKWRNTHTVVRQRGWDRAYCKACQVLTQNKAYQVIPSVAKWFN